MKKNRILIIVVFALAIGVSLLIGYEIYKEQVTEMERMEKEAQATLEISYYRQFTVFHLNDSSGSNGMLHLSFETLWNSNGDSLYTSLYCDLAYYEQQTGIQLSMNEVKEYLS